MRLIGNFWLFIFAHKGAEVFCQFCGEKYQFNQAELTALLHVADRLRKKNCGAHQ